MFKEINEAYKCTGKSLSITACLKYSLCFGTYHLTTEFQYISIFMHGSLTFQYLNTLCEFVIYIHVKIHVLREQICKLIHICQFYSVLIDAFIELYKKKQNKP